MSLVLDALRRVEKPDGKAGSVGVAVPSYRPSRKRRRSFFPLLLGLGMGLILLLSFSARDQDTIDRAAVSVIAPGPVVASRPASARGGAGLPQALLEATPAPLVSARPPQPPREAALESPSGEGASSTAARRALASGAPTKPPAGATFAHPTLVLQAISTRDSYPIAMVNDQLVKEGDLLGRIRVLRIGSDAIEVLFESGKREIIRFPSPPPSLPDPHRP